MALPHDINVIILEIAAGSADFKTLSRLARTSKSFYDAYHAHEAYLLRTALIACCGQQNYQLALIVARREFAQGKAKELVRQDLKGGGEEEGVCMVDAEEEGHTGVVEEYEEEDSGIISDMVDAVKDNNKNDKDWSCWKDDAYLNDTALETRPEILQLALSAYTTLDKFARFVRTVTVIKHIPRTYLPPLDLAAYYDVLTPVYEYAAHGINLQEDGRPANTKLGALINQTFCQFIFDCEPRNEFGGESTGTIDSQLSYMKAELLTGADWRSAVWMLGVEEPELVVRWEEALGMENHQQRNYVGMQLSKMWKQWLWKDEGLRRFKEWRRETMVTIDFAED